MKNFTAMAILGFVYVLCASTASGESICKFVNALPSCNEILLCEGKIKDWSISDGQSDRKDFMSPRDFSILLKAIEEGKGCAQRLGFTMFETSLKIQDAGYLEELSIALSYSIERNPTSFLNGIPDSFLIHDDVLGGLCCSVHDGHEEDAVYRKKHLKRRLEMLNKVTSVEAIPKREKVQKIIRHYLGYY